MHFSAKRGIAIACRLSVRLFLRLSVRPSVCDVGELWSNMLEFCCDAVWLLHLYRETYILTPAATLCDYYRSTRRRIHSDLLRRCATTSGLPWDVYTQTCCDAVRLLQLYQETYTLRPAGTLCDYFRSTVRRIHSCLLYTSDAADE